MLRAGASAARRRTKARTYKLIMSAWPPGAASKADTPISARWPRPELPGRMALSMKLAEQRLGRSKVTGVETFGEPIVDGGEKVTCRLPFSLIAQEPRRARGRSQFPRLCLLCSRKAQRMLEIRLRFRHVSLRRLERDFTGNAVSLGLAPPFLGCVHRRHCFVDAAPGIIESARICVADCQHELVLRCKYRRSGRPT